MSQRAVEPPGPMPAARDRPDTRLAELLAAGRVPERLVQPVGAALGPSAAELIEADPWALLQVSGVGPEQADFFARTSSGGQVRPEDPRRSAALAQWLLRRAGADGHTVLPAAVLASSLASYGTGLQALGTAVRSLPGDLVALPSLAAAEEQLAEALLMLVASEPEPVPGLPDAGFVCVQALLGATRRAYVQGLQQAAEEAGLRVGRASAADLAGRAAVLAASDVAVVEDAELLGVLEAARLVDEIGDGQRLVLVGCTGLLGSRAAGNVLADAVAAGLPSSTLDEMQSPRLELLRAVHAGVLAPVADPTREVVVVPSDDASAVRRTVQLVTDSIPRVLGISVEQVLVVTPRRAGLAGVAAVEMALAEAIGDAGVRPRALTVHEAQGRRSPAVVVVLPAEAAGSLSRQLVGTAFALADRHLSVVHACGPALAEAVAAAPRPRTTRLASLLTESA